MCTKRCRHTHITCYICMRRILRFRNSKYNVFNEYGAVVVVFKGIIIITIIMTIIVVFLFKEPRHASMNV